MATVRAYEQDPDTAEAPDAIAVGAYTTYEILLTYGGPTETIEIYTDADGVSGGRARHTWGMENQEVTIPLEIAERIAAAYGIGGGE
jgi:hypothetical protein